MTTFIDGPAKGQNLMLRAAPKLIRVTRDTVTGKFDALDMADDTPTKLEELHAYALSEYQGMMHVNRGRKGGGFYTIARYHLLPAQPTDSVMRSTELWEHFCRTMRGPQP